MVARGRASETPPPGPPAARASARREPTAERARGSLQALQRENDSLRLLLAIHDRLGALVLEGADVEAITAALSELMRRPVLLLDPQLQAVAPRRAPVADASVDEPEEPLWQPSDAYVSRIIQLMSGERRPLRLPPLPAWGVPAGCVLAPIVVEQTTLGFVAILEPAEADTADPVSAESDLLAVQHAASVYALALMRERVTAEVTTQLRDELFEGLLLGHVSDARAIRERARRLGYDEALGYRALVLVPEDDAEREPAPRGAIETPWLMGWRHRLFNDVGRALRDRAPGAIVTARPGELVVLLAEQETASPAALGQMAIRHAAARYPDHPLTVGVSGLCRASAEIASAYSQARRAVDIARRFGRRGEVARFEELGLYRLLFHVTDPEELHAFVEQVLGALIDYDRKHRTEFIRTLATYLKSSSLQATARDLAVHVNTIAYRMQRIQAVSGLDLTDAEQCLSARVALMIHEGGDPTTI